MTVQWVLGEIKCTPEGLAYILVEGMPGKLADIFTECEMLEEKL